MSGEVEIKIKALFDRGQVDAAVKEYTDAFNKLGQSVAQASKAKFNPVDRHSVDDMKRLNSAFDSFVKLQNEFRRRRKATGQEDRGMVGLDFGSMYPDPVARRRQMGIMLDHVMQNSGMGPALSAPPAAPPPPPGGRPASAPPQPPGRPPAPAPAPSQPGVGRQALGAGLNAMGGAGGVANRSLSVGMEAGLGAGLGALVGGLAAFAVGGIVKSIKAKVGDAEQEYIGYDTLKRQMGDVNVSFGVLKDSIRAASRGMDVQYNEGRQLAEQFAKLAGLSGEQSKTLGTEIGIGGGLSRSLGLDPSQGVGLMGHMRNLQVTHNPEESSRLGVLIGEGIAKSGAFAKADEVFHAIISFASQQTRMGLAPANVSGYMGMFSSMLGAHIPGMDPAGAASMLSRVNSSISGGGSEAWQMFMQRAVGSKLGLNPIQTALMRGQGAFGTGAGMFGSGSLYSKWAAQNGVAIPGMAAGSNAPMLGLVMDSLRHVYAGKDPHLRVDALAGNTGLSPNEALGFDYVYGKYGMGGLGGLQKRLTKLGLNSANMRPDAIASIAAVDQDKSLSDTAKDERIRKLAKDGQQETPGSKIREGLVGIQNELQDYASKTLPLFQGMRDGILFLAGGKDGKSLRQMQIAVANAESNDRADQLTASYGAQEGSALAAHSQAKSALAKAQSDLAANARNMTPDQVKAAQANIGVLAAKEKAAGQAVDAVKSGRTSALLGEKADLATQVSKINLPSINSAITPELMDEFNKTDDSIGAPRGFSYAQMMQESSFNPNAKSRAGAMGYAQVIPKTLASLEGPKYFNRKLNPANLSDAILIQRTLMQENTKRYGSYQAAALAYNSGTDPSKWGNPETSSYLADINSHMGESATAMANATAASSTPRAPGGMAGPVQVTGEIILKNQDGKVIGSTPVRTVNGPPMPAGVH